MSHSVFSDQVHFEYPLNISKFTIPGISYLLVMLVLICYNCTYAQKSPNIIVILSDDQGIDAVQGANWPNLLNCKTPNLSALANQGRIFGNARVNPYCSPTRAGLLTGRSGLRTGVIGVISRQDGTIPDRDYVSLQTYETTIAEVLRDMGYYTIHIDKWHCGYNSDMGQRPEQQGFMVDHNRFDYLHLDDPDIVGDEHLTRMVNLAINEVNSRPDTDKPYALFFWTIEPHKKNVPDANGFKWWRVDEALLPSGENYYHGNPKYDTEVDRYRAMVEALDTETGRMLNQLGVVDSNMNYKSNSNTVIMYLGDNGTPREVAPVPEHAKGTGYEGGIRVPFFVLGANVPDDGLILDRLVSHEDIFDTISDIVEAPDEIRGTAPRNGLSFADSIGWSSNPLPQREYTLSNAARVQVKDQYVVLADKRYKLFAQAGGSYLAPLENDEFYDLTVDQNETNNLVGKYMTREQAVNYILMRNRIVNYWNTAVGEPVEFMVDIPVTDAMQIDSNDDYSYTKIKVGHNGLQNGQNAIEYRGLYRFNIAAIDSLIPYPYTFDNVVAAQIIIGFDKDTLQIDNTDTGVITAHKMNINWHSKHVHWNDIKNAHDAPVLGLIDIAPYIITSPGAGKTLLAGLPMPKGTPVSLTLNDNLLNMIEYWRANPQDNHGIVLTAEPINNLAGDQSIIFMNVAAIRLSLVP